MVAAPPHAQSLSEAADRRSLDRPKGRVRHLPQAHGQGRPGATISLPIFA